MLDTREYCIFYVLPVCLCFSILGVATDLRGLRWPEPAADRARRGPGRHGLRSKNRAGRRGPHAGARDLPECVGRVRSEGRPPRAPGRGVPGRGLGL